MNSTSIADLTPNLLELVERSETPVSDSSIVALVPLADGIDGAPPMAACADGVEDILSDSRLKTDVERVGTTVYGLPLYSFRYTGMPERFEGVMAQDVLEVMPEAVVTGADGFYRVNYARLGVTMSAA